MHPLVAAFQGYRELVNAYDKSESIAEKGYLGRLGKEKDRWILELMASCPIPEFLVGFLMGHNNKVYSIWVWPLSLEYSQYFWVEDGEWSRPFTA